MKLTELQKKAALFVFVALVILSSFMLSSKTGYVIGVPGSCRSTVNFDAPKIIEVQQGEISEVKVSLSNVKCGLSYVRLKLEEISEDYYTISPTAIPVISPKDAAKEFSIYFDIPLDALPRTYSGVYMLYSNEGKYNFGRFELSIIEPDKPKAPIQSTTSSLQISVNQPSTPLMFWYAIGFLATVFAIIFISYEYFTVGKKHAHSEAFKRAEGEIYKALGVAPKKKEGFEKTLRKGKKR